MTEVFKTPDMEDSPIRSKQYLVLRVLAGIGQWTIGLFRPLIILSSISIAVLWQSCRPMNWRRTLVKEILRQCYLVGIGSLAFIVLSGMIVGLAMVFQFLYWLGVVGQRGFVGQIIVMIMVREIAPLLFALVVLGRSGSVNMVEMSHMRTSGQIRMLDAQGIDPFLFFIVPRCLATALTMFWLNIVFTLVAIATGFLLGSAVGSSDKTIFEFVNLVLSAMGAGAYGIIILKPIIAGVLITVITCTRGLSVDDRTKNIAQVLPLGFIKSVLAIFLVSGT